MKKNKMAAIIIVGLLLIALILVGSGGLNIGQSYEEQLATAWYLDSDPFNVDGSVFVLNEDGTGYIYGYMGRWEVVDGDELLFTDYAGRVMNFFWEDDSMKIDSLKNGCLILSNNDGSMKIRLYDKPIS